MNTYEEIYQKMKDEYEAQTNAPFNEESDIAIRFRVLAGEIFNVQTSLEWLKRQMFSATASGEYLDYLAAQRGLKRKEAKKSHGTIDFKITQSKSHVIVIPKGAVVATTDSEPVRFVTTEHGSIPVGNLGVTINAEAEKAGKNGNIGSNKAIVPVSVPAEIEFVTNSQRYSGGVDMESDDELRERIKASYLNQSNGTNKAYYEQLALSVEGITKAGVVAQARGTGTVNVYVCNRDSESGDAAVAAAQALMDTGRELNVDVKVCKAQVVNYGLDIIIWAKSGYGTSEARSMCAQAFRNYIHSLPVGGRVYLSELGKCLFDTGCIDNYQYNTSMADTTCSASQCFAPGTVSIEVR